MQNPTGHTKLNLKALEELSLTLYPTFWTHWGGILTLMSPEDLIPMDLLYEAHAAPLKTCSLIPKVFPSWHCTLVAIEL